MLGARGVRTAIPVMGGVRGAMGKNLRVNDGERANPFVALLLGHAVPRGERTNIVEPELLDQFAVGQVREFKSIHVLPLQREMMRKNWITALNVPHFVIGAAACQAGVLSALISL